MMGARPGKRNMILPIFVVLFKTLIYFILQLAFVLLVQFVFPAFCRMKKTSYHTIYPAALLLEQPANRTSGKVNVQLDPFPDGQ